jgi:hypothetical protein
LPIGKFGKKINFGNPVFIGGVGHEARSGYGQSFDVPGLVGGYGDGVASESTGFQFPSGLILEERDAVEVVEIAVAVGNKENRESIGGELGVANATLSVGGGELLSLSGIDMKEVKVGIVDGAELSNQEVFSVGGEGEGGPGSRLLSETTASGGEGSGGVVEVEVSHENISIPSVTVGG